MGRESKASKSGKKGGERAGRASGAGKRPSKSGMITLVVLANGHADE